MIIELGIYEWIAVALIACWMILMYYEANTTNASLERLAEQMATQPLKKEKKGEPEEYPRVYVPPSQAQPTPTPPSQPQVPPTEKAPLTGEDVLIYRPPSKPEKPTIQERAQALRPSEIALQAKLAADLEGSKAEVTALKDMIAGLSKQQVILTTEHDRLTKENLSLRQAVAKRAVPPPPPEENPKPSGAKE